MFSADDTADKLIFAMACSEAQVNSRHIRTREATREEYARVESAAQLISSLPMHIDGTPSPSVESMYYRCAMLNVQRPIRLAGMDYMELT
jgi:replicative DNA helicase